MFCCYCQLLVVVAVVIVVVVVVVVLVVVVVVVLVAFTCSCPFKLVVAAVRCLKLLLTTTVAHCHASLQLVRSGCLWQTVAKNDKQQTMNNDQ